MNIEIISPNTFTEEDPGIDEMYPMRLSQFMALRDGQELCTGRDRLEHASDVKEREARFLRHGHVALHCIVERESSLEVFEAWLSVSLPRAMTPRRISTWLFGGAKSADPLVRVFAYLVPAKITAKDTRWLSNRVAPASGKSGLADI